MKSSSASLLKLGIIAFPQILILLVCSSVRAELVTEVKTSEDTKPQVLLTNQLTNQANIPSAQIVTPKNLAQSTDISPVLKPNNTSNKPSVSPPKIIILSPTTGTVLDAPAATVVVQMPVGSKVELLVNGKAVSSSSIGRSELDETNRTITQTWYGVPLQAGENAIATKDEITETISSSVIVKVRGNPVKLVISTLEARIPADGKSYATIDGQLVDENGNRSNWDAIVTLEASDGKFLGTDASPEQPGFQVLAKQGKFSAQLTSGLKTGTVTVRAINAQMEAFTQVKFETDLRPSLVTGVIDLRVGARGTDFYRSLREFLPIDRDNRTQVDLYGAVFGTGRVGEWLFTGAFNNSRPLNQDCAGNSSLTGSEKYCDQKYPVYGDSSTSTLTTPSYDSLYLRFERNSPVQGASTDYLMWGNFNTEEFTSRSQQFSAISRQLQGFKGNFNLGDAQLTAFYSNIGKGFQRDTIAPNGTSGTYFLSRRLLVNGSENVFVELVDFFSAGTIVSRQELARGKDYDINYDNGSLLFRQPLLQTALADNGQLLRRQVVVTYQNEVQASADSSIYGGQLRYHFNRSQSQPSWVGANYFKENQGVRNFVLYGANALISFGEKTNLIGEYVRSENDSELLGFVTGSAMRFELNSEIFSGILGKVYYSKAETGFANNATISFVPGQTKYGTQLTAKLTPSTSVQFQYDKEDNLGVAPRPLTSLVDLLTPRQEALPGSAVDNSLRTISLGLQQNIGASLLNLDLLYRDRQDRQLPNSLSSNSAQLRSRLTVPILDNLKLSAQNEVSLSSSSDAVIPDRSVVSLDWTIVQGLTARLGQQWFHTGPLAGKAIVSADLVGDYKLGTDTSLTGRYSLIGGADSSSTQGALGLNQRWQVMPGLRLNFGYEHTFGTFAIASATGTSYLQPVAVGQSSSSLTTQNGNSYNIGAEYTDNPDLKASARFENRSDGVSSNTVFTASALGKLTPALTALFNYQQSSAANQLVTGLGTIANLKVGLAYRDPQDDKFNALLRYEYRQNPSIIPDSILFGGGTGSTDHTLALEGIYAPNWQWEFYGKLALRNSTTTIAKDFTGVSLTNLTQFRVTYRAGYNLELVAETRMLNQPTAGYSEMGLVGEIGYYLTPNLRLAAGYSSGSINIDRDFSGSRSAGGLYAGITVKLNELFDGFGLQKTPPREQQDPVEPVAPVAQPAKPDQKVAAAVNTPQIISLNVARSLTFKEQKQGNSAELAIADIAILENLAAVLKEYNNLSIDIQGYIGSLADMNSGDNLAANRMMAARKYLLDRGVAGGQMTLRSLGVPTASTNNADKISSALPVSFALSGKADVFDAIATRLQTISSNSPATEFLQSILPNAQPTLQARATTVPLNSTNSKSAPSASLGVNVGNDGKIADLSYATLDRMIDQLKANPALTFELQGGSALSVSGSQNLETFKLSAVRNYLLEKGVDSDRILLTASSAVANPTGTAQVYISLNLDDSNTNIAATPATPTQASATTIPIPLATSNTATPTQASATTIPIPLATSNTATPTQASATTIPIPLATSNTATPTQASATTIPIPLATSNTSISPLALLLESDRQLFKWLETSLPNIQFNTPFNDNIQIPNLGFTQLLTQLPTTNSFLLTIAIPENPILLSTANSDRRLSYSFETSSTQLLSLLLGDELNNISLNASAPTERANRRLASALNFLLTSNGDAVTAFLQGMGLSTTQKSGFVIDPDQLSNLKN